MFLSTLIVWPYYSLATFPQQLHLNHSPSQQDHYYDGTITPDGSFHSVNILPSQHTGLAGQVQVAEHSYQGNCDIYGKLIKCRQ